MDDYGRAKMESAEEKQINNYKMLIKEYLDIEKNKGTLNIILNLLIKNSID